MRELVPPGPWSVVAGQAGVRWLEGAAGASSQENESPTQPARFALTKGILAKDRMPVSLDDQFLILTTPKSQALTKWPNPGCQRGTRLTALGVDKSFPRIRALPISEGQTGGTSWMERIGARWRFARPPLARVEQQCCRTRA